MIADQHQVGIFCSTDILYCLHNLANITIRRFYRLFHLIIKNTVLMSRPVHISRMQKQNIRLTFPDHITGAVYNKRIQLRMQRSFYSVRIFLHYAQHLLIRSHPTKSFLRGIFFRLNPVLIDQVIDRRMVSGHRPEDCSCLISCLFCLRKNILLTSIVFIIPLPRQIRRPSRMQLQISCHFMRIRINTGNHRRMTRIRNRRINRMHFTHSDTTRKIFFKIRQCFQIFHILFNKGICREHN